MNQFFPMFLIGALVMAGLWVIKKNYTRSSEDVLGDLVPDEDSALPVETSLKPSKRINKTERKPTQIGSKYSISRTQEQLIPILAALLFVTLRYQLGPVSAPILVMIAGIGLAVGVIFNSHRRRKKQTAYIRDIEFFLPVVMERIVMAVQAGLDILAALRVVFELERTNRTFKNGENDKTDLDPVTALLQRAYQLTESGLSFEDSLNEVAQSVDSSPLRHAFIHLAMAHKEGGELVMPLKELSDATQLYFQESVEEDIAKMPVRATLPLLCTFAGLIICFITSPLIQVMEITAKATPK